MDAIDTQELLDFLTQGERAERLEEYFRQVEKRKGKVFISNYTLLELAYLLEYGLGVSRDLVLKSIRTILEERLFKVERKEELEEALRLYAQGMELMQALKEVQYEKNKVRRVSL
jgi:predicted nucleic-acid-binding protein